MAFRKVLQPQIGGTFSRRSLMRGMAGALAGVAVSGTIARLPAGAVLLKDADGNVLPAPKPIPGGDVIPPQIHVFEPGPTGQTLPYTGAVMEGLDVEPITITDFKGVIAQAYHVGTATGSDGKQYSLETDIRAVQGQYIAEDGTKHSATFALL
jgi:hypothetical protein